MIRVGLRAAIASTFVLTVMIGVMRTAADTSFASTRAAILPPDSCAAESSCWGGIVIGVTGREEAVSLLELHRWVGAVNEKNTFIAWDWNGAQPDWIDSAHQGLLSLQGNRVVQLRIQTTLRYGMIWLALGAPDHALLVRPVSRSTAFQIFSYDDEHIQVISTLGCPASPADLWDSTTTLGMGSVWTTEALNGFPNDIYTLPGWWTYLHPCRPPSRGTPR